MKVNRGHRRKHRTKRSGKGDWKTVACVYREGCISAVAVSGKRVHQGSQQKRISRPQFTGQ